MPVKVKKRHGGQVFGGLLKKYLKISCSYSLKSKRNFKLTHLITWEVKLKLYGKAGHSLENNTKKYDTKVKFQGYFTT